jgi:uncharacterized protein (DUF2336 family)
MADKKDNTPDETRPYRDANRLAHAKGLEARRILAGNAAARPDVLKFLAADPDPSVRREAARNARTPHDSDLALARDGDDAVRTELARKIARLTPNLPPQKQDALYRATVETLEVLVRDQLVQIRGILSDALKDVAGAPASVIRALAEDDELSVCAPVLEFSPVLTDDDLIEIIQSEPVLGALEAISRRHGLGEPVSDAIVDTGEPEAVAELLANPSAQIREDTLDRIVEAAPAVELWHAPLVRRPGLPAGPARKIAGFVADTLLAELRAREDLSAETVAVIADVVEAKIGRAAAPETPQAPNREAEESDDSYAMRRVRALDDEDELTEDAIYKALSKGDRLFVVAALAHRAQVPEDLIHHAIRLRSAKGVVALARKADFSMHLASALQLQLAGIPPKAIVKPRSDGAYPLDAAAMDWQLEFLEGSQRPE